MVRPSLTIYPSFFPVVMELQSGAAGWQLSNPPVLEMLCLKASYDLFAETTMRDLVAKSHLLTGYLELLIERYMSKEATGTYPTHTAQHCVCVATGCDKHVTIVTSQDPQRRGAQLSLQFSFPVTEVEQRLKTQGAQVSPNHSSAFVSGSPD